jgi:hypothetical protein
MSENKKTVTKGEKKDSFFKKTGVAISNFFKKAWAWVKGIQWNAPVKPVIAWSTIGGTLLVSVVLALIFWL